MVVAVAAVVAGVVDRSQALICTVIMQKSDGPVKRLVVRDTARRMDGRTDRRTDTPSYRDARMHLKRANFSDIFPATFDIYEPVRPH